MKHILYACTGLCAIGGVAHAQESAPAPGATSLAEVVVTAQRRSERLSEVPISVTAQTGEQLARAGVADTRQLANVVPGLTFSAQGPWAQPAIRGVSSTANSPGTDTNVAVYLDGVYQPNQVGNFFELPDVSRIEVLRGPQGTLFGRNATGGAIQIFTKSPTFDTTGRIQISAGVFEGGAPTANLNGFVSSGLVKDVLAASISGSYSHHDGYYRNIVTGRDFGMANSGQVRTKLLFTPKEGARVTLTAFYAKKDDDGGQTGYPFKGNTLARQFNPNVRYPLGGEEIGFGGITPTTVVKSYGGSLTGEFDLGPIKVSSITAYTNAKAYVNGDLDLTAIAAQSPIGGVYLPNKTMSQELNASFSTGPARWVSGLFYYDDDAGLEFGGIPPGLDGPSFKLISGRVRTRAYAAFGEGALNFTDRLSAIAGLRYSRERKIYSGALFGAPLADIGTKTWGSWTPRFSLKYKLNDTLNGYFTYSRGFKSGAFDATSFSPIPVNPEKIASYEVGLKVATPTHTFNISTFYYDYKDLQVQTFNNFGTTTYENASDAKIYGAEMDGTVRLSDNWTLGGNIAFLPTAKYLNYDSASALVPFPGNIGGNQAVKIAASGRRMIRAPKWTAALQADYVRPVAHGALQASASLYHSDGFLSEVTGRVHQDPYTTLNGSIAFLPGEGSVKISLYGRNLSNERYIVQAEPTAISDFVSDSAPREIGITVQKTF